MLFCDGLFLILLAATLARFSLPSSRILIELLVSHYLNDKSFVFSHLLLVLPTTPSRFICPDAALDTTLSLLERFASLFD